MISDSWRTRIIWLLQAAAVAASALVFFSFLAPWLPPADSVGHFRLYLVMVLALLAAFHVLVGRRRVAVVSAIALITGVLSMPQLFATENVSAAANFELVQANLRFDNADLQAFESAIAGADALALQEVSKYNEESVSSITEQFQSRQRCALTENLHVMVLSRHRSSAGGCGEGLAWMRLTIDNHSVTVVSIHLLWPWPFGQRSQLDSIRSVLSGLPQPMIVAGDFNAAPWSAAVADVARWSATNIVSGVRNTFSIRLPVLGLRLDLPLDHILVSSQFATVSIDKADPIGSDHLPIRTKVSMQR